MKLIDKCILDVLQLVEDVANPTTGERVRFTESYNILLEDYEINVLRYHVKHCIDEHYVKTHGSATVGHPIPPIADLTSIGRSKLEDLRDNR